MGKWDGGKLYWFCFIFWIIVFALYMVVGKNTEREEKYDYWMKREYNF